MFDLNCLGNKPRTKLMNFTPVMKENLMVNSKRGVLKSSMFLDFQNNQTPFKFERSIDQILDEIKDFRRSILLSQSSPLNDFLLEHSKGILDAKQDCYACREIIEILKEKAVESPEAALQMLLNLAESYLKAVRKIRMSTLKSKVKYYSSPSASRLLFKNDGLLNLDHQDLNNISDSVQHSPETNNEEDKKREFYSLCLSTKLSIPSDHPFQTLSISYLFSEASQLSPSKWQVYLNKKIRRS